MAQPGKVYDAVFREIGVRVGDAAVWTGDFVHVLDIPLPKSVVNALRGFLADAIRAVDARTVPGTQFFDQPCKSLRRKFRHVISNGSKSLKPSGRAIVGFRIAFESCEVLAPIEQAWIRSTLSGPVSFPGFSLASNLLLVLQWKRCNGSISPADQTFEILELFSIKLVNRFVWQRIQQAFQFRVDLNCNDYASG